MSDRKLNVTRRELFKKTGYAMGAIGVNSLISTNSLIAAPSKPKPEPEATSSESVIANQFKVITLGTGSPAITPDRMGPATLVRFGDKNFLVDVGQSCTASLVKKGIKLNAVTNVFFTHHHADHNFDYMTLAIGGWNGPKGRRKLTLVGPAKTRELHNMVIKFFKKDLQYRLDYGFPKDGLLENVDIKELEGENSFMLDGVKVSTTNVPHTAYTLAYRFDANGQSVVVSGDLTYSENLIRLSKNTDILVIDTHLVDEFVKTLPEAALKNMKKAHATVEDVARMGAKSGAKKMILTHLPPVPFNKDKLKSEIRKIYKGDVEIASDSAEYVI